MAMNDAFLAYAKRSCLDLSNKIHNTFPREVRDLIYSHVTGFGAVYIPSQKAVPGQKKRHGCSYFDTTSETELRQRSLDHVCEDHWWDEDFVGAAMRREIGENYYRSSYFRFGDNFGIIPRFRVTDQWNLGFLPVSYIGNVEVNIGFEDCRLEWVLNGDSWLIYEEDEWNLREKAKATGAEILVHLESLFGFRPGTAITIKVNPRHSTKPGYLEKQEWMCINILRWIFPVLQRLKDMNYKVRAILNGGTGFSFAVAPFVTEWNPVSHETVKKAFWKVSTTLLRRVQVLIN